MQRSELTFDFRYLLYKSILINQLGAVTGPAAGPIDDISHINQLQMTSGSTMCRQMAKHFSDAYTLFKIRDLFNSS